jgi:hypothetical protein
MVPIYGTYRIVRECDIFYSSLESIHHGRERKRKGTKK